MRFIVVWYDGNEMIASKIDIDGPFGIDQNMPDNCEAVNAVIEIAEDATPYLANDGETLVVMGGQYVENSVPL